MTSRTAAVVCLAGALLVPSTGRAQARRDAAGFVADVSGNWDLVRPGGPPLRAQRRTPVMGGDQVRRIGDAPGSFVVIALYDGTMREYKDGERVKETPQSGRLGRILRAIQQRFEEGFVTASVRGGGDFHDALIATRGGTTDLSDVFKGADAGAYSVSVYALERGRVITPARAAGRVEIGGKAVTTAALPPGLYQVDVSNGPSGAAGSAWIRVVDPKDFAAAKQTFDQLPRAAQPGSHEATVARSIARTYLAALDEINAAGR